MAAVGGPWDAGGFEAYPRDPPYPSVGIWPAPSWPATVTVATATPGKKPEDVGENLERLRNEAVDYLREELTKEAGYMVDQERVQLAVMILKELWPPTG